MVVNDPGDIWSYGHQQPFPDSKVHGANMGPIWVLSAPDGPHVGPMNLAIRVDIELDILACIPFPHQKY